MSRKFAHSPCLFCGKTMVFSANPTLGFPRYSVCSDAACVQKHAEKFVADELASRKDENRVRMTGGSQHGRGMGYPS